MSRKDTYSDAMNEWAAKQSFFRNRSNRFIHPDPNSPGFIRFLGYFFRVAIVSFIIWLVGTKVAGKYFKGEGFNEKLHTEITSYLKADELEAGNFNFIRNKAVCKKITATGGEDAVYRSLDAETISFRMPLLKRFKEAWAIDRLNIGKLEIDLKSGGKAPGSTAATGQSSDLIHAGLIPNPDFDKLTIASVNCTTADINWGLSRATMGKLEGAKLELTTEAQGWRVRAQKGVLQQNWIRDLRIDDLLIRKADNKLTFSDSSVRLAENATPGTLQGSVTLGHIPKIDLELKLPKVLSRNLLPKDSAGLEIFNSNDVNLDLKFTGSTNSLDGIETSGTATLKGGELIRIPVLEALDQLLKTNSFRIFSIDEGEVEFRTRGGKLEVTRLECTKADASSILRGSFTYSPPITRKEAEAANAVNLDTAKVIARKDHLTGSLQLGVRPSIVEANPLAKTYFTREAEGYMWIEIPLDSSLKEATQEQQSAIRQAINGVE